MASKKRIKIHFKIAAKRLTKAFKANWLAVCVVSLIAIATITFQNLKHNDLKFISTFSQWEFFQKKYKKQKQENFRSIASAGSCSFNQFNLALIKAEIKVLEANYQTGSPIEGKFYGLDLSSLPSIAAQMIADNKDLIGNQQMLHNYDFSTCTDVPCVLNKIYKDSSQLSGYATYFWYLKTGTMLSTSNYIPEQESNEPGTYSGKRFDYSDYLFTRSELKNFYFLAKSLPEKLTFIPLMKSIHKVPQGAQIENIQDRCSAALPKGQILLEVGCINKTPKEFFISVTREIAKYVDRHEGFKNNLASISQSRFWIEASNWHKQSQFNPQTKKYTYKWVSKKGNQKIIDKFSSRSPIEQFASLVAHYRFDPKEIVNRAPEDLAEWIKKNIYHGKVYDPSGLYKQYIDESVKDWSLQEVGIWKACLDQELLESESILDTQRVLASSLDHPLYACIEQKIPGFISYSVEKIKKEDYEGCRFFSEETSSLYGHQSARFYQNINKYILEKVLQRKTELKRHGPEVLIGYNIKEKFIKNIDPKAIFIECFNSNNKKSCYNNKMKYKLNQMTFLHPAISNYYKKTVEQDILNLFPYEDIREKTNELTKHFLAPYSARLSQAAIKMWDNCKLQGSDEQEELDIPLRFSGGRYYVNPKLVNCLNTSLESEIYKLAELKAFHHINNDIIEFRLKLNEQQFALTFLEGKLLQTLNNILEKEYLAEKIRLESVFKEVRLQALTDFSKDEESFFQNIFTFEQVKKTCRNKVVQYYPDSYFYHPKPQIDQKFGYPLCEKFVSLPNVRDRLTSEVKRQWLLNQEVAHKFLVENYQYEVDTCFSDNPEVDGRRPSNVRQNQRNKDRRDSCLEINYSYAIDKTLKDWREHKNYRYFAQKEDQLYSHLKGLEKKLVPRAKTTGEVKL